MTFSSVLRFSAAACGATLLAGAALAQSAPGTRYADGPRLMAYWQLPVDGLRTHAPRYGLRLDSAPLHVASLERLTVLDLQMQARRTTLHLSGMPVMRLGGDSSDSGGGLDSLSEPSGPGFWIGWTAVGLVVLCATRTGICKKNESSGSPYQIPE